MGWKQDHKKTHQVTRAGWRSDGRQGHGDAAIVDLGVLGRSGRGVELRQPETVARPVCAIGGHGVLRRGQVQRSELDISIIGTARGE